MSLPMDALRAVAERELAKSRSTPLFLTISGAHLYGFASPDSDFDVRGAHLQPLERLVSLFPADETVEYGYVMEQIFSPIVMVGGPVLEELRNIAAGCITRHIYHHYRGFTENELKLLEQEPRIKTLLYAYRVLLTGIHLLATGEIEANLPRLLELHPQDGAVRDLIAAKTKERAPMTASELAVHGQRIQALRARLETAFEASKLPEEPRKEKELDDLLVRLRLGTAPR